MIRKKKRTKIPLPKNTTKAMMVRPIGLPMIKQEQTNWCWAACADMVLHYYGNGVARQCEFASWLFGLSGCCRSSSRRCNQPCSNQDITDVYRNWGLGSRFTKNSISFEKLESEIKEGRPVEVGFRWDNGRGHVVLVIQTSRRMGKRMVKIYDPWNGQGTLSYNKLLRANGKGSWVSTWTGIKR